MLDWTSPMSDTWSFHRLVAIFRLSQPAISYISSVFDVHRLWRPDDGCFQPAFHDTGDTDILADILARVVARMSGRRVGRLPHSACHRNNFRKSIARVGRLSEDPREQVGVVECGLYAAMKVGYRPIDSDGTKTVSARPRPRQDQRTPCWRRALMCHWNRWFQH